MAFNLSSCGDDNPINDDEEEPTPPIPPVDEDETITFDLSKVTINEEDNHTYTSVFEVTFKEGNTNYTFTIKTNIYDYDELTTNQSIKSNIEKATLTIGQQSKEVEIKSGDITVTSITEDKLTLSYNKLTITPKENTRSEKNDKNEYIITGTVNYNINQRSISFTVANYEPKDLVAEVYYLGSNNNYDARFELSYNKFYITIKKENKSKIIKGAILNDIIEPIYYEGKDYTVKEGKIVVYQLKGNTSQLFFDNLIMTTNGKDVTINGLLEYKVIGGKEEELTGWEDSRWGEKPPFKSLEMNGVEVDLTKSYLLNSQLKDGCGFMWGNTFCTSQNGRIKFTWTYFISENKPYELDIFPYFGKLVHSYDDYIEGLNLPIDIDDYKYVGQNLPAYGHMEKIWVGFQGDNYAYIEKDGELYVYENSEDYITLYFDNIVLKTSAKSPKDETLKLNGIFKFYKSDKLRKYMPDLEGGKGLFNLDH